MQKNTREPKKVKAETFTSAVNLRCLLCMVAMMAMSQANAKTDPAQTCDAAAQAIAQESSVPLDVLRAITRTETGRQHGEDLQPWPWTVNMEGTGLWFDTEDQARVYVFQHFKQGARSFDVGCFQINYKWHGQAFDSIDEMFDPMANARYAAKFLTQLHAELGTWDRAAGAYHSRTQKYAQRYLERYAEIRENLPDNDEGRTTGGFALLQGQPSMARKGSLVPLGPSPAHSILTRAGG